MGCKGVSITRTCFRGIHKDKQLEKHVIMEETMKEKLKELSVVIKVLSQMDCAQSYITVNIKKVCIKLSYISCIKVTDSK